MLKKAVSIIMFEMMFVGTLALAFDIQKAEPSEQPATPWGDWKHYHNYTEIVDTLLYLNTTYPNIVDVFSIGESWQGRTIYCVRLTSESQTQPKPKVFFVGYHHSREPISAELSLYFLVQAATDYGTNETVTRMINLCDIYVAVALNPDGFHLFAINDWQRKNARPIDEDADGLVDEDPPEDEDQDGFIQSLSNTTSGMYVTWEGVDNDSDEEFGEDWVGGVDLNRNYGFSWNASTGGSTDPRSQVYKGPAPFSEPETQALRDLVLQNDFEYAVSFHSGAEIITYPWGYTEEPPPHAEIFDEIAKNLSTIIGCPYEQSSISLYTTSGTWGDWMYGNRSVIAFTCEIFGDSTEWFSEPGPTPDTMWLGGLRYAFNPRPHQIESVILRWLPVFTFITDRAISEAEEVHDVAVTGVAPSRTVVGQSYSMFINVTVEDQSGYAGTFNVTVYANTTAIETMELTLTPQDSTTITFTWNTTGFAKGNYTISANAILEGDVNIADNTFTDGWIVVTIPGDYDGDGDVDSTDLFSLAPSYGSEEGDPLYEANCDFDGDGDVDSMDLFTLAPNYGKPY